MNTYIRLLSLHNIIIGLCLRFLEYCFKLFDSFNKSLTLYSEMSLVFALVCTKHQINDY